MGSNKIVLGISDNLAWRMSVVSFSYRPQRWLDLRRLRIVLDSLLAERTASFIVSSSQSPHMRAFSFQLTAIRELIVWEIWL